MFEWYHLFIVSFVSVLVNEALRELKRRIAHPYRFTCPEEDCFYKISGNEKSLIDDLRTEHRREHLRQKDKAR